jgi:hypothetical protein
MPFKLNDSYFPLEIRYETDKDPVIVQTVSELQERKPFFIIKTNVKKPVKRKPAHEN